jgi:hypothetical protein
MQRKKIHLIPFSMYHQYILVAGGHGRSSPLQGDRTDQRRRGEKLQQVRGRGKDERRARGLGRRGREKQVVEARYKYW